MKNQKSFTPGPWEYDHGNAIKTKNGLLIANISRGLDDGEIVANANLIAAAPEMLEALSKVYCSCSSLYSHSPGCFMIEIELIIAKARGE